LQGSPSPFVPTRERLGLTVAVWAEKPQVLDAIIIAYTIDVIDLHAERLAAPRVDAAR
jgi:hypothetical protein